MPRFLVAFAFAASIAAQIPYGHLIYVHGATSATVPAIGVLDPDHGTATPLLPATGSLLAHGSRSVAIDPLAPNVLYSITSLSTSIAQTVPVLTLTGNLFTRTTLQTNLGVAGAPFHLRWAPGHGLLLLGRGGLVNCMFLRDMVTGTVTRQPTPSLRPNNASDMAFLGGKAYAASEGDGATVPFGTIVEWDLATNTDRVLGNGYPPLGALGVFSGMLLAGDVNGDLHLVDPANGAASPFLATGLGKITSIAVDPLQRVFVLAQNGALWSVHAAFAPQPPLHMSTSPLEDLEVGPTPVPTMLVYGTGCAGSTARVPALAYSGPPALGGTFDITLTSALPNSGAFLVLGSSRVADGSGPLPRALGVLGMPGCWQYTDIVASLFGLTGNTGGAQWSFALPTNPAFTGVRIPAQCLCLDPLANARGATSSNGDEAYVW